jgi:hypothetical protein
LRAVGYVSIRAWQCGLCRRGWRGVCVVQGLSLMAVWSVLSNGRVGSVSSRVARGR